MSYVFLGEKFSIDEKKLSTLVQTEWNNTLEERLVGLALNYGVYVMQLKVIALPSTLIKVELTAQKASGSWFDRKCPWRSRSLFRQFLYFVIDYFYAKRKKYQVLRNSRKNRIRNCNIHAEVLERQKRQIAFATGANSLKIVFISQESCIIKLFVLCQISLAHTHQSRSQDNK